VLRRLGDALQHAHQHLYRPHVSRSHGPTAPCFKPVDRFFLCSGISVPSYRLPQLRALALDPHSSSDLKRIARNIPHNLESSRFLIPVGLAK
jgi:hypothetical protein